MDSPTNIVRLRQPEDIDDPLTEVLRAGARRLLAQAVELEAEAFLTAMQDLRLPDGRARLVRHGHGPEREIQTGIGPVPVAWVRVRDRGATGTEDRVRFTSTILPKWARRTRSLDALLPVLYLRGVSTGDFQEALSALFGKDAPNLSPAVVTRLTATWADEYTRWQGRVLSARRYVYVWADGVYLQARMEERAECMLVLIGATPEGRKELVGFQVGVRESAQSWRELLVDVKRRGLAIAPEIAVGDGALGFWKALDEVWSSTRHQRCRVHKTANVLNKVPKSVQGAMKVDLREIHAAPTRAAAEAALVVFVEKYGAKYARAADCLTKDREALLALILSLSKGLRLPCRALGSPSDDQSDRERVRHGVPPDRADEGRALADHRQADGVQTREGGREDLAEAQRRKPVAQGRRRRHLPRRDRGHRAPRSPCRLIALVTQIHA